VREIAVGEKAIMGKQRNAARVNERSLCTSCYKSNHGKANERSPPE